LEKYLFSRKYAIGSLKEMYKGNKRKDAAAASFWFLKIKILSVTTVCFKNSV